MLVIRVFLILACDYAMFVCSFVCVRMHNFFPPVELKKQAMAISLCDHFFNQLKKVCVCVSVSVCVCGWVTCSIVDVVTFSLCPKEFAQNTGEEDGNESKKGEFFLSCVHSFTLNFIISS